jgi:general secretion pathway protein K
VTTRCPSSRDGDGGGRSRRRSGGFALIIVLWTLVLIAFITTHLVATGRVELQVAGNLVANAVTKAAADGAVYQAVFNQMDPTVDDRWPLDGSAHVMTIGDCRVTIRLTDEAGRINPNLAAPELLAALLQVTGSDAANAQQLAAAIAEWISAPAGQAQGTVLAEYRAAGLDYSPPGEPLESLDELRQVRGMTPATFDAIRPHLSLFAPAVPTLTYADPVVTAAMAATGNTQATPPQQSDTLIVHISAAAEGPGNAGATHVAIVQLTPGAGSYSILATDQDAE